MADNAKLSSLSGVAAAASPSLQPEVEVMPAPRPPKSRKAGSKGSPDVPRTIDISEDADGIDQEDLEKAQKWFR